MNTRTKLLTIILAFGLSSGVANAAFSGDYALANWTFVSSDGGGSFDVSGAPNTARMTSSDIGNAAHHPSTVDATVVAMAESIVSFHGEYLTSDRGGPAFDTAGFLLNGIYTQLSDDFGANFSTDDYSFHVNAGDTFGFRMFSIDSAFGSATGSASNFEVTAVPEPETYAMFMAGLGILGFMARRRKNGQS